MYQANEESVARKYGALRANFSNQGYSATLHCLNISHSLASRRSGSQFRRRLPACSPIAASHHIWASCARSSKFLRATCHRTVPDLVITALIYFTLYHVFLSIHPYIIITIHSSFISLHCYKLLLIMIPLIAHSSIYIYSQVVEYDLY